jgi:hypothetical protein
MAPWVIFFIAGWLLILVFIGGLLLARHKRSPVFRAQKLAGDTWLLYLLLWLASLSIVAYIAFAFGKR